MDREHSSKIAISQVNLNDERSHLHGGSWNDEADIAGREMGNPQGEARMHFDPEYDKRPLERLGWLFRYLNQFGAPTDPVGERKPLPWAQIADRMGVPVSDVSKIARISSTGRKRAGTMIFGRAQLAFGVKPDFWWVAIQGEPDIELHVLAERRAGRELSEQRSELDQLKEQFAEMRDEMRSVIQTQQQQIEALSRRSPTPPNARRVAKF